MDGGDSLKRIERRSQDIDGGRGELNHQLDSREGGGDYFLSRNEVDKWELNTEDLRTPDPNDTTPCQERWHNMSSQKTSCMWDMFDETGIFVSLCRHGMVLKLADMVKSGERYVFSSTSCMYT